MIQILSLQNTVEAIKHWLVMELVPKVAHIVPVKVHFDATVVPANSASTITITGLRIINSNDVAVPTGKGLPAGTTASVNIPSAGTLVVTLINSTNNPISVPAGDGIVLVIKDVVAKASVS